ncbi:hypothetical protein B0G69_3870 [Paraburkholderia sp. RAU2J]|nr:hypothetical protein B0G69_3870 [Paraburkholderia sp. RAU2J]
MGDDGYPLSPVLGFLPTFQCRERIIEPFDSAGLRRHADRVRNRVDPVAPIGQRDTIFSGNMRNNVFQMFDIFFKLMMVHCFPVFY